MLDSERYSYDDFHDIPVSLATQLQARFDVRTGDRVAISMRNYPEWCFSLCAACLLGASEPTVSFTSCSPRLRSEILKGAGEVREQGELEAKGEM